MIHKYVKDIAAQMGVEVSETALTCEPPYGAIDAFVLAIHSGDKLVKERVHQLQLDSLEGKKTDDVLEIKIKAAMARLKMQLAP